MNNSTFFKIALLIILAGIVFFFATPKFTFNQNGAIRKNIYFGTVESRMSGDWVKLTKKKSTKISEGFVIDEKKDDFIPDPT